MLFGWVMFGVWVRQTGPSDDDLVWALSGGHGSAVLAEDLTAETFMAAVAGRAGQDQPAPDLSTKEMEDRR
jgi:hypothetical protein